MDKVYLKQDIKSDHLMEKHPNLVFGILIWPVSAADVAASGYAQAAQNARATENVIKSSHLRAIRTREETYSRYLTEILTGPMEPLDNNPNVLAPVLPPYVISYGELQHPRIERQNRDWVWISYETPYTNGQRVTKRFRNAFDWSMLEEVPQ